MDKECEYARARGSGRSNRTDAYVLAALLHCRRPGILVLINDADWELEGELEYELEDGDEVCFISTLHGG